MGIDAKVALVWIYVQNVRKIIIGGGQVANTLALVVITDVTKEMVVQDAIINIIEFGTLPRVVMFVRTVHRPAKPAKVHNHVSHASQDIMELLVSITAHRVMVRYVTGVMGSAHMYVQTNNISTHLN